VYGNELNQLKIQSAALTASEILLRNDVMKEGIKILYQQVNEIKLQYPFTIEEQIRDEEWVAKEVEKIYEQITQLNNYEKELVTNYSNLINSNE